MQNNRIGFGIHNREPPLKFFKKILKVDPDCRSLIRILVPDRNREPFREPFFQNRERESGLTFCQRETDQSHLKSMKFSGTTNRGPP